MLVLVRIVGLALLIAGILTSLFIPTWGRHIVLASIALIIVGAVAMAAGTRRRHSGDSVSGGVYGDASGLNIDRGGRDHDGGHDVGHGGDSGDGGGH